MQLVLTAFHPAKSFQGAKKMINVFYFNLAVIRRPQETTCSIRTISCSADVYQFLFKKKKFPVLIDNRLLFAFVAR